MVEISAPDESPGPIRWFGTSWVDRGWGYWVRRAAVSAGALVALAGGAGLLWLGVQGVFTAQAGSLVDALLVVAVGVCSCVAAVRNWHLLGRGRESLTGWMTDEKSIRPMLLIGFLGALAAYFLRSLVEAPGEARERARYLAATVRREKRRTPGTRKTAKRRG